MQVLKGTHLFRTDNCADKEIGNTQDKKKNIVSPRWNSIQLKTNLTYMECKCYKKDPIWIVFVHNLTPKELRKDFKGRKRENEYSTDMESAYLLLFVSTNHCYLIIFLVVQKN